MQEIQSLVKEQKAFFNTGQTKDAGFRKAQLNILQKTIRENRAKILDALQQDLSKSAYEGYLTEVGIVLDEIRFIKKHLSKWAKARRVRTHLFQFPGSSYIYAEPYGVSLIISPWNYPFQLVIGPLIGSMAAGNCSVVKPSEYAPRTARVFNQIISDNFEPNYIAVVEGEAPVSQALLAEDFDYIFFTGSVAVGKTVMQAAARHLTPVTLELGGKSPCIVDRDVNLDVTMQSEIFGPILPVLAYSSLSEAVSRVKELPKPLAFYYFSNNRQNGEKIIQDASFGGGCINDTLLHFANPHLPFGGTGSSGIGSYHGKKSFETFSHQKSILKRSFRLDAPLRYPPYGNKLKILEKIMR